MFPFRLLNHLSHKTHLKNRTFFTLSTSSSSHSSSISHPLFISPSNNNLHYRFFPLFSKWVFIPFQKGPLFLASPPWKLSQSATPLYLQGNRFVRQRVQALNLNLNNLLKSGCSWAQDYLKNPNNGMSKDDQRRQVCNDVKWRIFSCSQTKYKWWLNTQSPDFFKKSGILCWRFLIYT